LAQLSKYKYYNFNLLSLNISDSNTVDNIIFNFTNTQLALGPLATATEVEAVFVFLASDKASAITGQCINVDCGVYPQ